MKKSLTLLLLSIVLYSCTSHKSSFYRSRYASYGWSNNKVRAKFGDKEESNFQKRVVIYNADLTLVVKNTDSVNAFLTRLANKYEGYVVSLGNETSVIRVKSNFLSDAINDVTTTEKVKRKTISGDDVTEEFEDYNIRLENATKARQRYLELLTKAENVEATLKVEKELERLNTEISLLEGKIKRMQHLSDFSTITVSLEKKIKPGILGYIGIGLYKGIKWLIIRN